MSKYLTFVTYSIAFSQLRLLEAELERLHEENRKLRSMLEQVSSNYSGLQTQLLIARQTQAHQVHLRDEVIDREIITQRFFMTEFLGS